MRHIGVDFGTKRVGLALSDEGGVLAFPHQVVAREGAAAYVAQLASAEGTDAVVLGESKDLAGNPNPVMQHIERFKEELETLGLRVVYEPELMTSAQAARNPLGEHALPASPSPRERKDPVDASAAALILQAYLDRKSRA